MRTSGRSAGSSGHLIRGRSRAPQGPLEARRTISERSVEVCGRRLAHSLKPCGRRLEGVHAACGRRHEGSLELAGDDPKGPRGSAGASSKGPRACGRRHKGSQGFCREKVPRALEPAAQRVWSPQKSFRISCLSKSSPNASKFPHKQGA